MKMKNLKAFFLCVAALAVGTAGANAQKYGNGLIDKSVAVVGEEMIKISAMEEEIKVMRANGMLSDKNVRCDLLEQMIVAKIFLMQARVDSLNVNNDMVESSLNARLDQVRTQLGGDEEVEKGCEIRQGAHHLRQAHLQAASGMAQKPSGTEPYAADAAEGCLRHPGDDPL